MSKRAALAFLVAGILPLLAAVNPSSAQDHSVTFSNPPGSLKPDGITNVVEISGAYRLVFLSGKTGTKAGKLAGQPGDFKAQAHQAFQNIEELLASVGGSFRNVVKVNLYMTDMSTQLDALREVRAAFVDKDWPPTSTTVEVSKLPIPGALFEIDAVAILPPKAK